MADNESLVASFRPMARSLTGQTLRLENPGSDAEEPDDLVAEQNRAITEHYQAMQAAEVTRSDFLPPVNPNKNPLVDVGNILLHDDMASVGMSMDTDGFAFNLETAKDMWSEHPIRASIAMGSWLVPAIAASTKAYKANKFRHLPDTDLLKLNLADSASLLAMSEKDKRILQQQAYALQRTHELEDKVQAGTANFMEQRIYNLRKSFGNTYIERTNPDQSVGQKADWIDRTNAIIRGKEVTRYLKEMPDAKHGTLIARYFTDPTKLKDLPPKVRPWAMNLARQMRTTQEQALGEGFITGAEHGKVGDIWFSTMREGSKPFDQGVFLTEIEKKGRQTMVLRVPRTTSPHLAPRQTQKTDVKEMLLKQQAAEMVERGETEAAMNLLKGKKFDATRSLIRSDQPKAAIKELTASGRIDTTPESLTVNSYIQQRLLFENFRYLRDVAMNADMAKPSSHIATLSGKAQREWKNLDGLHGSDRVRRMVGAKMGKLDGDGNPIPVDSLGYVRRELFDELTKNIPEMHSSMVDWLETFTAIHKTSKTAFNLPTHFQNILGNHMFLMMAGFNTASPKNWDVQWKSWNAVRKMQTQWRKKGSLDNIGDLGQLESQVGGAPIRYSDELMSPELNEIVESSSLLSAEGTQVLDRLYHKAGDHQGVMKGMIKYYQKALGMSRLDKFADTYMAEDGFAKMSYFMNLRSRGFTRQSAAIEVGRRMPMYHTIGEQQKKARAWLLPWISFPSEALRVTMNNAHDYPLRVAGAFHFTNIIQSLMYPATGDTYQGLQDTAQQLPMWAQKPQSTVVTPFRDDNDDIRGAILDWMPHSSFLPGTVAKDAPLWQKMPLGAERLAPIITGITTALSGKDPWGRDIPVDPDSVTDKVRVAAVNMASLLTPPLFSKYVLNTATPTHTYRLRQDMGRMLDAENPTVNPATTKPGTAMYDFFINNLGVTGAKMYAASPEQQLANESMSTRNLHNYRGRLTRDWNAFVRSGDTATSSELLRDIQMTFNKEFPNPGIAQKKFTEWLKRHWRTLRKHPQLRNYSKERLIAMLSEMGDEVSEARSVAMAQRVAALRKELAANGMSSKGGSTNPLSGSLGNPLGSSLGGGIQ